MKRVARSLWTLTVELVSGWWVHLRTHWRAYAVVAVSLAVAAWFLVPMDEELVELMSADRSERMLSIARNFSSWGDLTGTLVIAGSIGLLAWIRKNVRLGRIAWAVLVAAALGGLAVNVLRFSTGRPRPISRKADGLYGPTTEYRMLGFPSAHSATAAGTAATLSASIPVLGVAVGVLAAGVLWSRIHRRRHHPTDVLVGAFIGALFGIGIGRTASRARRDPEKEV